MPANDSTYISPETRVSGSLSGDVDVTVAGQLDGEVNLTATLTITEQGRVDGTLVADEIVVHGTLTGTVRAKRAHLSPSARVTADLDVGALRVDDGAILTGAIEMDIDADVPAASTSKATSTSTPSRSVPSRPTTARPTPARPVARPVATTPAPTPKPAASNAATATTTTTTTTTVVEEEPAARLEETTEVSTEPLAGGPSDAELEALDELTVKELREALRLLDLPVSGSKSELVERLAEAQAK